MKATFVQQEDINETIKRYNDFFVTSDTWFGRRGILEIANRKFADINDMNNQLVKRWNKIVDKTDIVFHLGNFAWDPITCENVLKKLNGIIVFLKGNCDDALLEQKNVLISQESILLLKQFDVVLCHYPLKNWPGKDTGTVHFHGHETYNNDTVLTKGCNVVNVCTDFWEYKPVKFSDIRSIVDYKN